MTYRELWRASFFNYVIGMLVSVVPGFAFYYVAFDYSPSQLHTIAWLAIPGTLTFLSFDAAILSAALKPLRVALSPIATVEDSRRGIDRLLSLPVLVLPRVFGPHAIIGTLVFNSLVVWANRDLNLGIPEGDFPLYWLLNLTVIPVGHVVYEYHACERLIARPLALLLQKTGVAPDPRALVRFPLARRIFLFSGLLGLTPPIIGGFIAYQRITAIGITFNWTFYSRLAIVGLALSLLWLLLLAMMTRELNEQTRGITAALDRIADGDLSAAAPIESISEFGRIAASVNEMSAGLRERQQIRDLFGAYMTRDLANQLLGSNKLAATERKQVTVLFVDIRGFTSLSTKFSAETVVELLNQFFAIAVAAIAAEGGHVNKFLGDGLLAVFGAPVAVENAPDRALRAAIAVRHKLDSLNASLVQRNLPPLKMGAAIHAGEVVVGTIGSPEHKLEYTVIGEAVNLASRLEGLNKQLDTEILLSKETADQLKEKYSLVPLPAAEIRGIPRPVEIVTWKDSA